EHGRERQEEEDRLRDALRHVRLDLLERLGSRRPVEGVQGLLEPLVDYPDGQVVPFGRAIRGLRERVGLVVDPRRRLRQERHRREEQDADREVELERPYVACAAPAEIVLGQRARPPEQRKRPPQLRVDERVLDELEREVFESARLRLVFLAALAAEL